AVKLRVPSWATQGVTVKINGEAVESAAAPGSYVTLQRECKDADRVEYSMPMSLHIHRAADMADSVAVMYGPIVLAGEFGTDGVPSPPQARDQHEFNRLPRPEV